MEGGREERRRTEGGRGGTYRGGPAPPEAPWGIVRLQRVDVNGAETMVGLTNGRLLIHSGKSIYGTFVSQNKLKDSLGR